MLAEFILYYLLDRMGDKGRGFLFLVFRLCLGAALFVSGLRHSYPVLGSGGFADFQQFVVMCGLPSSGANFLIGLEFTFAFLIIVGLLTRVAALFTGIWVAIQFAGFMKITQMEDYLELMMNKWPFAAYLMILCVFCLILLFSGAGRYSLGNMLFGRHPSSIS